MSKGQSSDMGGGSSIRLMTAFALLASFPAWAATQGPWNAVVLAGGTGLQKPIPKQAKVLAPRADWTAYAWVRPRRIAADRQLLAGVGDPQSAARYFLSDQGRLAFWWGNGHVLISHARIEAGQWAFVAAVAKGDRFSLYLNGHRVAHGRPWRQRVAPRLVLGPATQPWAGATHFSGKIADFTVEAGALNAHRLAALAAHPPGPLTRYEPASPHWPVQTHQVVGQAQPQPPSTLPHSNAPFSRPVKHAEGARVALKASAKDTWTLGDWSLASATKFAASTDGQTISSPGYQPGTSWLAATVPGTVLTTLVNRGVYPNPDYGLNNMAIPESLNTHDWWYRTAFKVPAGLAGKHLRLTFNGINDASEIWINGKRIGSTRGAFARGMFDVTRNIRPGQRNVIAARVSPPPHPGIPNEESLVGGPGLNGGMQELDGPTFLPTEGWDWMPAARDRDTGIWQDVTLHATGPVSIGDTRVVTTLPDPDHSRADVKVDVPLTNHESTLVHGTLQVTFGGVRVGRPVALAPGTSTIKLSPSDFPQLVVKHPHLWWPNGYGKPCLYEMHVRFATGGKTSDQAHFHFGIREISYELSLFDQAGRLRRVLINLDRKGKRATRILNVTHKAILKTPHGWAYSLMPGALHSPAVTELKDTRLTPYLAIRVNGVRIAIKGGSWGMDDWRKRVSRKRLEPYFKLQKKAHLNVIRNWVGQNTEPVFYQLADKYGLLVFNGFWQTTQNSNIEPQDDALFVRNAKDVIRRYRNHPSVALWFGRNEGVPQPLLNKRLDRQVAALDGTRLYLPSSNDINLQGSGPYNYQPPRAYFTKLARGFSVEVGSPSFPTLEAFKAMMPKADWWPISDDWAYHDWHQGGNGGVATFMTSMRMKFGEPDSLADFARKAQMMNYVTYRAIFEGFNAHLWSRNSGRMLWMSQPAWPSTMWQLYSHDYDTSAAYYGAMKGAEPVHVQMNLPDRGIDVVNNTKKPLSGLTMTDQVYALDGHILTKRKVTFDAPAGAVTPVDPSLNLNKLVAGNGLVFVALQLRAGNGRLLSRNFYWTAQRPAMLRRLDRLPRVKLRATAEMVGKGKLRVRVRNPSSSVALSAKLTVVNANGKRMLPAYYSDNYINLAPGGMREVTITVNSAKEDALLAAHVRVRGWNIDKQVLDIKHKDR